MKAGVACRAEDDFDTRVWSSAISFKYELASWCALVELTKLCCKFLLRYKVPADQQLAIRKNVNDEVRF